MTSPKGFPSSKKSMSGIPGYSNEQTTSNAQFNTLQDTGSDRVALDVTQRVAFKYQDNNTVAPGSTKRLIKTTLANTARKGDIIKFVSGTLKGIDCNILSVPDANTVILAGELDSIPAAGVDIDFFRYTFWTTDEDGSLNVVSTPGPTRFIKDTIESVVTEDTVDPTNNNPFPNGLMIMKDDGKWYPVKLDQTNPYSHTPIPVCLTDVLGSSVVNVTASDLNVSIKHNGADPSSVRLGDGTTEAGITSNNELKVKDAINYLEPYASDIYSGTIDNVSGAILTNPTVGRKKIRLVQNSGADLYLFNGGRFFALEKGGKAEFFFTFDGVNPLVVKTISGSATINLAWTLFQ